MWNIQNFPELPSTQLYAKRQLQAGKAKHGDVITTLHQTEGRGRNETRSWLDEPGSNVLMSIVLTEIPTVLHDKMQFVAGLSVLEAVRSIVPGENIRIKWPNDILHDWKKISGVISEAIWSGNILKGMVIGIGINVNQQKFPDEVSGHAISLCQITGREIPVEQVRDLVLSEISRNLHSAADVLGRLRNELEWLRYIGHFSLTDSGGTNFPGLRYDGITDEGSLVTISGNGEKKIFQNASMSFQ